MKYFCGVFLRLNAQFLSNKRSRDPKITEIRMNQLAKRTEKQWKNGKKKFENQNENENKLSAYEVYCTCTTAGECNK